VTGIRHDTSFGETGGGASRARTPVGTIDRTTDQRLKQ
jgi:hypothetical protein